MPSSQIIVIVYIHMYVMNVRQVDKKVIKEEKRRKGKGRERGWEEGERERGGEGGREREREREREKERERVSKPGGGEIKGGWWRLYGINCGVLGTMTM